MRGEIWKNQLDWQSSFLKESIHDATMENIPTVEGVNFRKIFAHVIVVLYNPSCFTYSRKQVLSIGWCLFFYKSSFIKVYQAMFISQHYVLNTQ